MGGSSASVSCYGKLPFHPEYLRIGLESPSATAIARWVERAHEALSTGKHGDPRAGLVSFACPVSNGKGVVAGVIRQSSDGLRRHPIALFVEERLEGAAECWHLLPLVLADAWIGLGALLDRPFQSVGELEEALKGFSAEVQVDAARDEYATWLAGEESEGPWGVLTGASGDEARNLAANFLALAHAQCEARAVEEGVAMVVPLASADPSLRRRRACLWLDLFASTVGGGLQPTIGFRGDADPWEQLCALYRPADGADLAALLATVDSAPIDQLGEVWQTLPAAEGDAPLERVVATDAAPLTDLRARLLAAR